MMSTFSSILLSVVGVVAAFLGWKLKGGLAGRELNKAKNAVLEAERKAQAEQALRKAAQQKEEIMEAKARSIEHVLRAKEVLAGKEQRIDEETPSETGNRLNHMFDGFSESGAGGPDGVSDLSGNGPGDQTGKD